MKVKEITVGISQTLNVGNYEAIKPSLSLRAELEDGEDAEVARTKLSEMVQFLYMREVLSQLALYNSKNNGGHVTLTDWVQNFLTEFNKRD